MDGFLMKPKVDFAFKEIMADERARTGFLAAVLRLDPEEIKETRILNTFLRKEHEEDKQGILDVRILMNNDTEIDTEIQISEFKVWANRSLFYLSKMYTEQIETGQNYDRLKKCVSISILDFDLFHGESEYYSCFHIREDTRHTLYTDKMEFHVIELPKLPAGRKEHGNNILSWARFISAERKEDFDMLAEENPFLESAYQRLQVISQDKQKRMEYEARMKALRDHNQLMQEAVARGIEIGEQRGRQEGLQAGLQEGLKTAARNMLARGLDTATVSEMTGLTAEELAEIGAE